jgi:hypothetical protein
MFRSTVYVSTPLYALENAKEREYLVLVRELVSLCNGLRA